MAVRWIPDQVGNDSRGNQMSGIRVGARNGQAGTPGLPLLLRGPKGYSPELVEGNEAI